MLIGYAEHRNRSHDALIRVYDVAGNVIEVHRHKGNFVEPDSSRPPDPSTPLAVSPPQRLWPPYRELLDVLGLCRIAPLDSPNLSKASYDQEPRLEVQVPYMAHLLGIASLVLGDVSHPDL